MGDSVEEESGNHVEISRCHFLQNVAKDGGALSLSPSLQMATSDDQQYYSLCILRTAILKATSHSQDLVCL